MQAIIFDFDGLIINTESPDYETWQEVFTQHGCHLNRDTWLQTVGSMDHGFNPYDELARQLGRAINRDQTRAQRRKRYIEMVDAQPLMSGVMARIEEAKGLGLKLAIASSSDCSWVKGHLQKRNLWSHFPVVTCRDDVQRTKPDPAVYQVALARLGVPAAEAIALEDSRNGILAAKAAGMLAIAVPNEMTRGLDFQAADLILNSLSDISIATLIEQLGNKDWLAN